MNLQHWLSQAAESVRDWQSGYPAFETHPSLQISDERFTAAFAEFADRMRDNYPYFHPSYAGQMLKPPHPAAVAGYLAAMLVNPNNHALDGGKVTSEMEKEVVADLAAMFGLGINHGGTYLGHLTSSGTIANLEALYVARELHPARGVAYSADAHYTHGRMCGVLGINGTAVGTDAAGRIDLDALDDLLAGGTIGTVVATAGTTGLGAIDPVHDVLAVARRHGVRVHVDAAYGGFFTLLATTGAGAAGPGWTRGRGARSPNVTRSSSTPTSTGCSPTVAERCCSPTRRSAGSMRTTRRTPTSPPTSCIWARSAWSAPAPARQRPHYG